MKSEGYIFWIPVDTYFIGTQTLKEADFCKTPILNCIIQDHIIKFYTEPHDYKGGMVSFFVELIRKEHGTGYIGSFVQKEDSNFTGEVSCELFENDKAYLLFGAWLEDGESYTWIAKFQK